ncbi:MAG: hypothetical protein AB1918_01750 [Pseudomonadota bacterium]
MISLHWIGSTSQPRRHTTIIRIADAILDWVAADRERLRLAALDDRALADFGANRCDVEREFRR